MEKLDTNQITRLGGELGLNVFKLEKMKTLPDDMVRSWLRQEDDVKEKCSDPLTWEALVNALRTRGQTGIADEIFVQKCQPSGRSGITMWIFIFYLSKEKNNKLVWESSPVFYCCRLEAGQ